MAGQQEMTDRIVAAMRLAAEAHAGQKRKGTERPYISHPLLVAALVWEDLGTEDEIISALLHDVVEDAGGLPMLERIWAEFGEAVGEIVVGCSDNIPVPGEEKPPWRERKEEYLQTIAGESDSTRHVSLADKVANARDVLADYRRDGRAIWKRFRGAREGTLWYYRALVDAFRVSEWGAPDSRLLQELDAAVTELERLAGPAR